MSILLSFIKNYKGFFLFVTFLFILRGTIADWHPVPTGSMKPTILEGDVILQNKMAYDLHVPFTDISLLKIGEPKRGDIIVFTSSVAETRLIKRLIGLPGDVIKIQGNNLFINGNVVNYDITDEVAPIRESDQEEIAGTYALESYTDLKPHAVYIKNRDSAYPPRLEGHGCIDVEQEKVPEGHYFFLGDNRDSSSDSRCIGYVPRSELRGHATRILLSLNKKEGHKPRFERFLKKLR